MVSNSFFQISSLAGVDLLPVVILNPVVWLNMINVTPRHKRLVAEAFGLLALNLSAVIFNPDYTRLPPNIGGSFVGFIDELF